ncbi:uncharacterized protein [Aristolochia californica]|uniref:uncharacterized protein n=1 Tax=Aristolochia californica TaxID=171875 RepID=UPI0035E36F81
MTDMKGSTSNDSDIRAMHKEWDDASCPICMDHPHNAVLLLCSSHDKGCRSYVCDTSYRHSNCLDRLKKLRSSEQQNDQTAQPGPSYTGAPEGETLSHRPFHSANSEPISRGPRRRRSFAETHEPYNYQGNNVGIAAGLLAAVEENNDGQDSDRQSHSRDTISGAEELGDGCTLEPNSNLTCPLCRGTVRGWKIVKEARQYLDLKQRSCSRESCSFSGNYRELRRHARRVHPTTRPADVDPSRQRAWRHLEHQQEYGDIVSAIRAAMPGAIVIGDYVIDTGDGVSSDRESVPVEGSGSWWTTFFLFHMISPMAHADEQRGGGLSRAWRRHRRSSGGFTSHRRHLWGENLLGLQDEDEEDWNLGGDMGDDVSIPRRRRRFTRARPDEDQP